MRFFPWIKLFDNFKILKISWKIHGTGFNLHFYGSEFIDVEAIVARRPLGITMVYSYLEEAVLVQYARQLVQAPVPVKV